MSKERYRIKELKNVALKFENKLRSEEKTKNIIKRQHKINLRKKIEFSRRVKKIFATTISIFKT